MAKSRSPWQQAQVLAEQTPDSRNRSVDFLRAISILIVVIGHWVMSSPWWETDSDHMGHILTWAPWTHWMTWGLQVMPIFFFVGGSSNGIDRALWIVMPSSARSCSLPEKRTV